MPVTQPDDLRRQQTIHFADVFGERGAKRFIVVPQVHHDALEFPDGTRVLLTSLVEGQEATVLQLPAQPKTPAEDAAQRRVVYVG